MREVKALDFKLQNFNLQINVSRIANVHYFEFTGEYHTQNDYHNFCELLYVDRGAIDVHSDNYSGQLSVNQLLIHRPNEVHSLKSSKTIAPNVIIIGFECDSEKLAYFSKKPVTLMPEHRRMLANLMNEAMSTYEPPYDIPNTAYMKKRKNYPFGADQMIKITLEAFLISIIRDFTGGNSTEAEKDVVANAGIRAVHQYLTENYTTKVHLNNICFLFGTNKTTLCNNFKKEYNITILGYLNALRIKEAKALIRERKLTITQISAQLGFDSAHYFCRVFKKATGQSPTEYAKTVRAKLDI